VAQARRKPRIWSFAIQIVPGPDSRQAIASQALSGIRKVLYRTPVAVTKPFVLMVAMAGLLIVYCVPEDA
jgi:hypothetical protein